MTREQIENEAYLRLDASENEWDAMFNSGYSIGFMSGAQWRINSVWHDVSEEPKEHKLVLIEDDFCGEPDMVFGKRRSQIGKIVSFILVPNVGHILKTFCPKERRERDELRHGYVYGA